MAFSFLKDAWKQAVFHRRPVVKVAPGGLFDGRSGMRGFTCSYFPLRTSLMYPCDEWALINAPRQSISLLRHVFQSCWIVGLGGGYSAKGYVMSWLIWYKCHKAFNVDLRWITVYGPCTPRNKEKANFKLWLCITKLTSLCLPHDIIH